MKPVNAWFQNKRASKKRNRVGASADVSENSRSVTTDSVNPSLVLDFDDYREPPSSYRTRDTDEQDAHLPMHPEPMVPKLRHRPSFQQGEALLELYHVNPNPSQVQRNELSDRIGMSRESVNNWFYTRRSRSMGDEVHTSLHHAAPPHIYSAFPPPTKHPSLDSLPPASSHPSLSLPPISGIHRSPSLPPAVEHRTSSVTSRRTMARRSSTPYSASGSASRARRTRPEPHQLVALRKLFDRTPTPTIEERSILAAEIGMELGKVTNWFRNLRQTARKRAARLDSGLDDEDDEGDNDNDGDEGEEGASSAELISRSGTPLPRSSYSASASSHSSEMNDEVRTPSEGGSDSDNDAQEAVTPSPEPAHAPLAAVDVLNMVVDANKGHVQLDSSFAHAKREDALLLLSFHNHVVH